MRAGFQTVAAWAFGILALALFALSAWTGVRLGQLRADVRYANEIMQINEYYCRLARSGGVSDAADSLWRLHVPSLALEDKREPFHGSVARLVERNRRLAVSTVILYLKDRTADDLGDDPEPWIQKYATDAVRGQMAAVKEALAEDATAGRSNIPARRTGAWRSAIETNGTSSPADLRRSPSR